MRKELFKLGLPSVETRIEEEEKELGKKLNTNDYISLRTYIKNEMDDLADYSIRSGEPYQFIKTNSLSSLKWERIKQIFQVKEIDHKPNYPSDFFPISEDKFDSSYDFFLFRFNQNYVIFNERMEELFIDPILTMANMAYEDVSLNARFPIESDVIPIKDIVDFCLIRPKKLTSSKYFIVEVKEEVGQEKTELLNKAMAQCFSAMKVMAVEEQRDKVYGLVTDFNQWRFLEITNQGTNYYSYTLIDRLNPYPTKERLRTLIIYLYDHMKKTFGKGIKEK